MYKIFCLVICCAIYISAYAQLENVWIFGKGAGVDFNSGTPVAIPSNITGWGEGCASVCDNAGRLLFYTEGSYVWDANGNIMPNGSNLTPIISSDFITSSTSQGALIVPMTDHKRYFIFSLTAFEQGTNLGRLYYSVVDMSLNSGKGDVIAGQKGILLDTFLSEHMTAVLGDRCNAWLIVSDRFSPRIKSYEITDAGVNSVPIVSTFSFNTGSLVFGRINASPDRKKLAIARSASSGNAGSLELYDFSPSTGKLSNQIFLDPDYKLAHYGVCFSPDNSKLYHSLYDGTIDQFDLSSGNTDTIIRSKTFIGTAGFADLKRAVDGKIYCQSDIQTLGAILSPNMAGTACQYIARSVPLYSGKRMNGGLPSVVPVLRHDTLLTAHLVKAGCFANVYNVPLQANDTGGWDYIWNTGITGTQSTADTQGLYWVTYYTAPCVFHTDTFNVQFSNGILPKIATQASCKADRNGNAYAYTFPGDSTVYNYTWRNSNDDILSATDTLRNILAGSYNVNIITDNCDTVLSLLIPEEDIHVSFVLSDTLICIADTIVFQNTSDVGFNYYLWSFGDGDSSSSKDNKHAFIAGGSYNVILIGKGNICNDTTYRHIIVDTPVHIPFSASSDSICLGAHISFITQSDGTITSFDWLFGDGSMLTTAYESTIDHAYDISGLFPVVINVHSRACPDISYADTIYVTPPPIVNLGADTGICPHGRAIVLKNLNTFPGGTYLHNWSTGDTSASISVTQPGNYSLTINKEPLGCSTTDTILINKDCYLDVPNAFTPNGDGNNDYFFPREPLSSGITEFNMTIYNRWGQKIFETQSISGQGWDGKFNSMDQAQGVYVYLVTATFKNGSTEQYKGNVTLLR